MSSPPRIGIDLGDTKDRRRSAQWRRRPLHVWRDLGMGCGGCLAFSLLIIDGPVRIGGEWGHNPLP